MTFAEWFTNAYFEYWGEDAELPDIVGNRSGAAPLTNFTDPIPAEIHEEDLDDDSIEFERQSKALDDEIAQSAARIWAE